uniref:Tubulin polyglutamylase TTLL4 n=1 Tax=Glossina brevipalpis TaxID=37001 RepID=A0A1A9WDN5_9MUSC
MASISDKKAIQQNDQTPQTQQIAEEEKLPQLKENTAIGMSSHLGGAQSFVQNALSHSKNQAHHHYHRHHHHGHIPGHSESNHRSYRSQHTKENALNRPSGVGGYAGGSSKKGIEILDFHESWLEEMAMYRDIMYMHKNPQPLLGNPTNQTQALLDNQNASSDIKILRMTDRVNATAKVMAAKSAHATINAGNNNNNNANNNANAKRKGAMTSTTTNVDSKQRVRMGPTLAGIEGTTKEAKQNTGINRRPREETPAVASQKLTTNKASSKRSGNTSPRGRHHSPKKGAPSAPNQTNPINSTAVSTYSNAKNTSPSTTTPHKTNMKIIVNQFHASSLLSGHEFEEKAKILTQNGLTKNSASTAYEASFYATNYLMQNDQGQHGMNRILIGDSSNYVGVSLAKINDNHRIGHSDDDPCAAIDDVNTYTDTDSEEEYVGEPFFLEEDIGKRRQSKHIRCPLNQPEIPEPEITENTSLSTQSEYYTPKSILTPSLFPNVPAYLNFSSHADKGPNMPQQLHKILKWKLSPVMPKIVKRVVLNSGFRVIKNTTDWMAIWEKHMKSPGFRTIRSHQKYNHMPGSFRIGRKDTMWRSIQHNVKKYGSREFGFMQKSYIMPDDLETLRQAWPKNASRLTKWIVKPPASARGTGIRIVNKWSQFPKDRPLVVQKYIERPLLINDNKFDMRIYVVLTSINPLRIYLYKDGLARFASVKYSSELNSLDERCMHLTNYSINKFSQNYSKNEDFNACQGHKWTLQSLWSCLESRGVNTKRLWATLRNLVIKAIISGEAGLNRMYRQNVNFRYNCFELFGFDVLLDENLIPWLLEINISPSLHSELPLDLHVKGPLIQAVLNTALYQVPPKLTEKQQKEILQELEIEGPLCHDKRIFTTCLTAEEVRKHNHYTNRSVELREEYLESILENLMPDDVRCLIVTEDELARCKPLERIFPTPNTHVYLSFIDNPRYYNRLLDAWETRYGHCREQGIELLANFCKDNYHLNVSDAAMEKEPNVSVTEIDMLHIKKNDDSPSTNTFDTSNTPMTTTTKFSDSDLQSHASNDGPQDEPSFRPVEGQGDELVTNKSEKHIELKSAPAKNFKNLKVNKENET